MHRFTLEMTNEDHEKLREIAKKLNDSKKGVIRRAIWLLSLILNEKKNGHSLYISDGEGNRKEIFIL